jgi:hypothetical protein
MLKWVEERVRTAPRPSCDPERPLAETIPVGSPVSRASSRKGLSCRLQLYSSFLVVGLIAGWLAGQVVKGTGFGLVADIAIGIVVL